MALESLPVEFLYSIHLDTGAPVMVTDGPSGTKLIAPVVGGHFEGPRLKGKVGAPAGDWVTIGPAGQMTLDVRLCLTTEDGANIFCSYRGIMVREEGGLRALGAPLFETGDERYAWLNSVQGIGIGSASAEGVEYEIYALK